MIVSDLVEKFFKLRSIKFEKERSESEAAKEQLLMLKKFMCGGWELCNEKK